MNVTYICDNCKTEQINVPKRVAEQLKRSGTCKFCPEAKHG